MTPERWQQVKQIFQSALERNPAERSAFLNQACADDPALRSEVESLISSHDQAGDSIEAMAVEGAAEMLGDDQAGSIVGKQIGHYQVLSRLGGEKDKAFELLDRMYEDRNGMLIWLKVECCNGSIPSAQ